MRKWILGLKKMYQLVVMGEVTGLLTVYFLDKYI